MGDGCGHMILIRKSTEKLLSSTYSFNYIRKIRDISMVSENSVFAFGKKIYHSNAWKLQNVP